MVMETGKSELRAPAPSGSGGVLFLACKWLSSPSCWNIFCYFFQQSLQGGNIKIFIPGTGFRGAKRLLIRLKEETFELIE